MNKEKADLYDERCVTGGGCLETLQFKHNYMGHDEAGESMKECDLGSWGADE